MPAGAEVTLSEDQNCITYPVANDGEVYISDMKARSLEGSVSWSKHTYYFSTRLPNTNDPIIELGDVPCY